MVDVPASYVTSADQLPPCTWPIAPRTPCGFPSLYGFRLTAWPAHRRSAICALHARILRGRRWNPNADQVRIESVWLAARLPPAHQNRRRDPVRSPHPGSTRTDQEEP